jgi:hypothetical protein
MLCIFSYQTHLQAYARVSLYFSWYLLYIFHILSTLSQHCLDICFLIKRQASLNLLAISTQSHSQKLFCPTINHLSSKRSKSWMIGASFHSFLLYGFFCCVFESLIECFWKQWHLWLQAFGSQIWNLDYFMWGLRWSSNSCAFIHVLHNVKVCKILCSETFIQVTMKFNVKVCKFLFLEAFDKVSMKSRLWW